MTQEAITITYYTVITTVHLNTRDIKNHLKSYSISCHDQKYSNITVHCPIMFDNIILTWYMVAIVWVLLTLCLSFSLCMFGTSEFFRYLYSFLSCCKCTVNESFNPQGLQLHFFADIHQLILFNTKKKNYSKFTQEALNQQLNGAVAGMWIWSEFLCWKGVFKSRRCFTTLARILKSIGPQNIWKLTNVKLCEIYFSFFLCLIWLKIFML